MSLRSNVESNDLLPLIEEGLSDEQIYEIWSIIVIDLPYCNLHDAMKTMLDNRVFPPLSSEFSSYEHPRGDGYFERVSGTLPFMIYFIACLHEYDARFMELARQLVKAYEYTESVILTQVLEIQLEYDDDGCLAEFQEQLRERLIQVLKEELASKTREIHSLQVNARSESELRKRVVAAADQIWGIKTMEDLVEHLENMPGSEGYNECKRDFERLAPPDAGPSQPPSKRSK